jgi:hypothetical protein
MATTTVLLILKRSTFLCNFSDPITESCNGDSLKKEKGDQNNHSDYQNSNFYSNRDASAPQTNTSVVAADDNEFPTPQPENTGHRGRPMPDDAAKRKDRSGPGLRVF